MEKEKINQTGESGDVNTPVQDVDYVSLIKEMKEKSVPVDKYNKLAEEHTKLLHEVIDGGTPTEVAPAAPQKSITELRDDLFNSEDLTNLDYCKKSLELRARIMEEGGVDPFLPQSHHYSITSSDVEIANKVAETLQECIDEADGNSEVFTALITSRLVEPPIVKSQSKRR